MLLHKALEAERTSGSGDGATTRTAEKVVSAAAPLARDERRTAQEMPPSPAACALAISAGDVTEGEAIPVLRG